MSEILPSIPAVTTSVFLACESILRPQASHATDTDAHRLLELKACLKQAYFCVHELHKRVLTRVIDDVGLHRRDEAGVKPLLRVVLDSFFEGMVQLVRDEGDVIVPVHRSYAGSGSETTFHRAYDCSNDAEIVGTSVARKVQLLQLPGRGVEAGVDFNPQGPQRFLYHRCLFLHKPITQLHHAPPFGRQSQLLPSDQIQKMQKRRRAFLRSI